MAALSVSARVPVLQFLLELLQHCNANISLHTAPPFLLRIELFGF